MKGTALWKEVIRYQWYDVLFDRFYTHEYVDLPVNDLWQDVARKITFSWGLCSSAGLCLLLFLLALRMTAGLLLIPIALGLALLAITLSSCASCVYLYFRMRRHYKDEAHREKMEREGYGELHADSDEVVESESPKN